MSHNPPASFPENDFTRMIDMTRGGNLSGVRRVGVASATPLPTVQSAALGRPVEEPPPLTREEREELDRQAIAAGVLDPRLGNQNTDGTPAGVQNNYASMEEALAAGAPVNAPPTSDPTESRQTAREFLAHNIARGQVDLTQRAAAQAAILAPRIPNFRQVEGIDLVRNTVVLDGLAFPITDEKAAELKQFVVEVARDAIMTKLEEAAASFAALKLFAVPAEAKDGGESTGAAPEVQP